MELDLFPTGQDVSEEVMAKRSGGSYKKAKWGSKGKFAGKSMKPGGGGRAAKLKSVLQKKKGVKNVGGLIGWIGRKNYGKSKFQKMAGKGRSRAAKRG